MLQHSTNTFTRRYPLPPILLLLGSRGRSQVVLAVVCSGSVLMVNSVARPAVVYYSVSHSVRPVELPEDLAA